ncbi:MAG: hypothetical protein K2X82_28980 [Gemmataceae bacterium]|nr:hypothetical protein [Gemmataceae bacterium]
MCGIASLVKPGILFLPLIAGVAAVVLPRSVPGGLRRKALHLAVVAAAVVLPGTAYAWFLLSHHAGRMMPHLLVEGWFYQGVAENAWAVVGPALVLGLLGIGMAARAGVYLPAGLLVGHLGTLAVFTFHAATHDYYQVPLLAVTAVGLAWPVAWAERRLAAWGWCRSRRSQAALVVGLMAAVAVYLVATRNPTIGPWRWLPENRAALERATDERQVLAEQAAAVRAAVGSGAPVIELAEGYGYPLRYDGWADAVSWPRLAGRVYMAEAAGRPFSVDEVLRGLLADGRRRYFVVTDWYEWEGQPDLQAALAGYGPPREPAPGVLIFDLRPGEHK